RRLAQMGRLVAFGHVRERGPADCAPWRIVSPRLRRQLRLIPPASPATSASLLGSSFRHIPVGVASTYLPAGMARPADHLRLARPACCIDGAGPWMERAVMRPAECVFPMMSPVAIAILSVSMSADAF